MATIKDVARECGYSIATISAALNGVTQGVRKDAKKRAEHICRVAKELGYRPRGAARTLRSQFTRVVGIVMRNTVDLGLADVHPNLFDALVGISLQLSENGYLVSMIPLPDTDSHSIVFQQHMLDGMIALGFLPPPTCKRIRELDTPVMLVDNNVWRKHNCLRRDECDAGRKAARCILEQGCENMLYLTPRNDPNFWAVERFDGVGQVAKKAKIPLEKQIIMETNIEDAQWNNLLGKLSPRTGVIAETAYLAHWLVCQTGRIGLNPGRDYAFCSCESSSVLRRSYPQIHRVDFDRIQFGRTAAKMLLSCLENNGRPCKSQKTTDDLKFG